MLIRREGAAYRVTVHVPCVGTVFFIFGVRPLVDNTTSEARITFGILRQLDHRTRQT